MLGLPSTTEVDKRIPKEAFYRNLKMSSTLRTSFIEDIDKITVRNSIKNSTTNIPTGAYISEIMVLEISLKARHVPVEVLSAIARQNPHKLLFACTYKNECALAVMLGDLVVGQWQPIDNMSIQLCASNIDALWDSMASQIAYGDIGSERETVEQRHANDAKLAALKDELIKLETRRKKENQFTRKNAMFEETKALKARIAALESDRRTRQ